MHFSFNKYNNQSLFFFRYHNILFTSFHLVFKMVLNREVVLESKCQHYVDALVNTQHTYRNTFFFIRNTYLSVLMLSIAFYHLNTCSFLGVSLWIAIRSKYSKRDQMVLMSLICLLDWR